MLEVLDFCCGGGGFSLGFQKAGFHVKYAIDHDVRVKETFEKNHPKTEFILGDVREIDPQHFKDIDILIGSPPCVNLSVANKNKDIEKGLELVRVFFQWVKTIKPDYWIMENVPPLFKILKDQRIRYKIPSLKCLRLYLMTNYGLPQKRLRLFTGNYVRPKLTHSKVRKINILQERIFEWLSIYEALEDIIFIPPNQNLFPNHDCLNIDVEANNYIDKYQGLKILNLDEPSPTITDNHGNSNLFSIEDLREKWESSKSKRNFPYSDYQETLRRLTIRECARLQSFPDDFIFYGGNKGWLYKIIGNAVPPVFSYLLAKRLKGEANSNPKSLYHDFINGKI